MNEKANIYPRVRNENKFNYQVVVLSSSDKQKEDDQVRDEVDLYFSWILIEI